MTVELVSEVYMVFGTNLERPDDNSIVSHSERWEPSEVLAMLRGKTWKELTLSEVLYLRQNLTNLTDIGFRYYLPAFLCAALDDESGDLEVFLLYSLVPPEDSEEYDVFHKRMSELTRFQKRAVHRYIKEFYNHNPIYNDDEGKRTLNYWRQD